MERKKDEPDFGRFDLNAIANGFPDTAETLLLDNYLTDEEAASVRVFRFRDNFWTAGSIKSKTSAGWC